MGLFGQGDHVVQSARAIVDLRQHHRRDALVDRSLDRFRLDDTQLVPAPERGDQALRHVEIGREVAGIGENHPPIRPQFERRGERLVDP